MPGVGTRRAGALSPGVPCLPVIHAPSCSLEKQPYSDARSPRRRWPCFWHARGHRDPASPCRGSSPAANTREQGHPGLPRTRWRRAGRQLLFPGLAAQGSAGPPRTCCLPKDRPLPHRGPAGGRARALQTITRAGATRGAGCPLRRSRRPLCSPPGIPSLLFRPGHLVLIIDMSPRSPLQVFKKIFILFRDLD